MGTGPRRKVALVAWQRRGIEMATAGTALVPLPYQGYRVSISDLDVRLDAKLRERDCYRVERRVWE